jgi:hypothetical protein
MRWPAGTTIEVGQISISSAATSPGFSGCFLLWV